MFYLDREEINKAQAKPTELGKDTFLQGIITDERSYNAENLGDLKTIWYQLKDDDDFNVKCAALTLIFEARSFRRLSKL